MLRILDLVGCILECSVLVTLALTLLATTARELRRCLARL
jgi:hypothetical protein